MLAKIKHSLLLATIFLFNFLLILPSENPAFASANSIIGSWGYNAQGQVGDGTFYPRTTPYMIPNSGHVSSILAGPASSYGIADNGTLGDWGQDSSTGQLCDGQQLVNIYSPQVVSGITVTQLAAGNATLIYLKSDGTVWGCGRDDYGQLGQGVTHNYSLLNPVQVQGLSSIVHIAMGGSTGFAVKSDGTVYSWGSDACGVLGRYISGPFDYDPTPTVADQIGTPGFTSFSTSGSHGLGSKSDGSVWAWGCNNVGQLGNGSTDSNDHLVPGQVSNIGGVTQVSAGGTTSLALKSDGTIYGWGNNAYGQLGDNSTTNRTTPVRAGTISTGVEISAADGSDSYAVLSDGTVWDWGYGGYFTGCLGNGLNYDFNTPQQVFGLSGISHISAGGCHVLVLHL
ncbi:hypothetical protein HY025_03785 [Candidatus Daviesbacteria bacterium]|nr:hypothetical protein [Candidatus Daviesbacteria bacterium]